MRRPVLYLIAAAYLCPAMISAHDFEISLKDGQHLYFNITDSTKHTVEVTYAGSITNPSRAKFNGTLVLTSKVRYNNKVYSITSIGAKAFCDNTELKCVELPTGLTQIGDFAFEGCSRLTRIVFPTNAVKIGTGAFFKCSTLSSVALGSEWTTVNLKDFQWSKSLNHIKIPTRVKTIKNMKALAWLQTIEVDSDNQYFKTTDGVLYSKNGETLLGCPKGRQESLKVAEGTKTIRKGALADCRNLTLVVLPESLKNLSFREFSLLTKLKTIVMKADTPIMTARSNGKDVFLLNVANTDVKLVVNRKSKKEYTNKIASDTGEYTDIPNNQPSDGQDQMSTIPYPVDNAMAIGKDRIVGVKDFNEYQ